MVVSKMDGSGMLETCSFKFEINAKLLLMIWLSDEAISGVSKLDLEEPSTEDFVGDFGHSINKGRLHKIRWHRMCKQVLPNGDELRTLKKEEIATRTAIFFSCIVEQPHKNDPTDQLFLIVHI
ncbi:hypothetical protein OGAPHI_006896 [Ogataea philodendri]|uniref:Uncharacterized protein n=1 Tax=Ogataea philodendri TaxID=1378263 RepID=A0A9P8NVK1_9ASCO|nr:uncharacterized protein OGAPHI_006896 [Ogataea philodendri]KAH3660310.1 hypothetical protein OGAPHI_006896 [Ogataea philodendri]